MTSHSPGRLVLIVLCIHGAFILAGGIYGVYATESYLGLILFTGIRAGCGIETLTLLKHFVLTVGLTQVFIGAVIFLVVWKARQIVVSLLGLLWLWNIASAIILLSITEVVITEVAFPALLMHFVWPILLGLTLLWWFVRVRPRASIAGDQT